MALCGVSSTPNLQLLQSARNSNIGLKRNHSLCHPTSSSYRGAKPVRLRCSSSASSNVEMEEDVRNGSSSVSLEDESAHVMQFKWNDFKILDRVSIGHGGRVCIYIDITNLIVMFWNCPHFAD